MARVWTGCPVAAAWAGSWVNTGSAASACSLLFPRSGLPGCAQPANTATQTIAVGEDPEAINAMWVSGHNIFDQSAPINARPRSEFGEELTSQHPGGVNVLFADGSVHFLKNSTALPPLAALCTRALGEVLSSDSY